MVQSSRSFDSVLRLFDAERSALIEGRLDAVASIVEERERELKTWLEQGRVAQRDIERVRALAKRNAVLIEAARQGLSDGAAKIEEIRAAQSRLGTYDASGQLGETTTVQPRHERRA